MIGITMDASGYLTNYGPFQTDVRGIVVHSLECDPIPHIAEELSARGGYLDNEGLAPQRMTDPVSVVKCVPDVWSAGHIGGPGNQRYVGVETSGRAVWTRPQWLDGGNAQAALEHQAWAVANLMTKLGKSYSDIRWLSIAQLQDGYPFGLCDHNDISVSGVSHTNHWDPGLGFPHDWFLARVQHYFSGAPDQPTEVPPPAEEVIDMAMVQFSPEGGGIGVGIPGVHGWKGIEGGPAQILRIISVMKRAGVEFKDLGALSTEDVWTMFGPQMPGKASPAKASPAGVKR